MDSSVIKKLTYVQLSSLVSPSFWSKLTEIKLDVDKLSETERHIWGYYPIIRNRNISFTFLEVDSTSFNQWVFCLGFCFELCSIARKQYAFYIFEEFYLTFGMSSRLLITVLSYYSSFKSFYKRKIKIFFIFKRDQLLVS